MKKDSVLLNNFCFINTGFNSGADRVTKNNLKQIIAKEPYAIGDGIFIISKDQLKKLELESDLIYQFYKNSNISRYYKSNTSLYCIYTNKQTKLDNYPKIKKHLEYFKPFLEIKREYLTGQLPWYSMHWPRDNDVFINSDKIIFPYRAKMNIFAYSSEPFFGSKDILYLRKKENSGIELKYILALLNSKLYYQWIYCRGKRKGETLELYQKPISEIPINKISMEAQKPFIDLVDKILEITSAEDYDPKNPPQEQKELEKQIDKMVYELYGLTEEEIKIVEDSSKK